MSFWLFVLVALGGWLLVELVLWLWKHSTKGTLTIIGATNMADVGKQFLFTVVAKNSGGVIVPDLTITVSSNNGTATVNPDGSGGVLTPASAGTATLTATDGTLTTTLDVPVVDNVPASLTIVPA
jgi:hypothetical protein